jgi:3-deoxy-manno-octulosonate cytidylyltransferase (CMP-KDO synthetase)
VPVLVRAVKTAQAAGIGPVTILAGDDRILDAARDWGLPVEPAFFDVLNGSERIAQAIRRGVVPRSATAINLQGDAVGAGPGAITAALSALLLDPEASLATVVVAAEDGGGRTTARLEGTRAVDFDRAELYSGGVVYRHIGVYAYRVDGLLERADAPPGPRELELSLEQLRWIEAGLPIAAAVVSGDADMAHAVDTPSDFDESMLAPASLGG